MSGANANGLDQSIKNTFNATVPDLDGYNTTPGGANFVEMAGGTVTFSFATPVQFFGAFLSGVQDFTQDTITFSDGTSETINVPETGTSPSIGELAFVGFTDVGKPVSSVTINAGVPVTGFDAMGVDDVQYQSVSAAPEPGSIALLVTICVFLALAMRSRPLAAK